MSPVWIVLALLPILGGAERFACRGRILGAYYADAKSGCKAFHVCVRVAGGGIRDFRFYCPPGTLFHQEAQTCTDWGDDDPLACPADIYDGQFDLYKIGSAYDTKKLSSSGNREDESEYGLQRAETGDRRLSQSSPSANSGASDLRTAHSSDFFSGQRDRGRDESIPQTHPPASSTNARQSFRRPSTTTQQPIYPTTQITTPQSTIPPQSVTPSQYEPPKRKTIRKRPIYSSSTSSPNDFVSNNFQTQNYPEQQKHDFNRKQQSYSEQTKQDTSRKQQSYSEQSKQDISRQSQNYFKPQKQDFSRQPQSNPEHQRQNYDKQQQSYNEQPKQDFNRQPQNYPEQQKKDFNRRPQINTEQPNQNVNRQSSIENIPNPPSIKNLPLKYQDEYVEVPRVSPKTSNRFYPNTPSSPSYFSSTQASSTNNQKGLVELYNFEAQSTPGFKSQNDNKAFKLRNSFNVQSESPKETDYKRYRNFNAPSSTAAIEFNGVRGTSTPSYTNFNSVSYEQEKNNFIDFSPAKQTYFYSPTTTPYTTTIFTTTRFEPLLNVNTIAYNTNIGFDTQSPNYSESIEDDGQYRPPQGEDDGQYRPELYERESELLTGAHSLNIAASNRLPEDQKQSKVKSEKSLSKPAVPRPFRPAPTPFTTSTTAVPETYPTTPKPVQSTPRNFDYYKTYTTTSRPYDISVPEQNSVSSNSPISHEFSSRPKSNTETAPRPTNRPISRETYSTSVSVNAPKSTRPPHFSNPPNKKEDSSYDYAYYDSDPGFSEYDQIEEFGKTKSKL